MRDPSDELKMALAGVRKSSVWPLMYPYPEIPAYIPVKYGDWEIRHHHPPGEVKGYFSGYHTPRYWSWVLVRHVHHKPRTWMSLTPMELESQAMQIQGAHGKVGIGGLGMGMALFNILKKGSVTKVYVYERQPNVIELLKKATDLKEWIGIEKLQIIEKNIFTAEPAVPLDYLYLDIWPLLGDNRAIPDTQKIQKRFQARHVTWWGLELDFIDFMRDAKINFFDRKSIDIVRWREALELPIYVGRHDWFLDSIEAVAMNVITGGFL